MINSPNLVVVLVAIPLFNKVLGVRMTDGLACIDVCEIMYHTRAAGLRKRLGIFLPVNLFFLKSQKSKKMSVLETLQSLEAREVDVTKCRISGYRK